MIVDDSVLNRSALAQWMDEQNLGSGDLGEFVALAGGTQNVMAMFTRGGRRYVVRRGPRHLRPHSNRNIAREMTLLEALRLTDVPHARLVASCRRDDVLDGAVFYLMEPVDGFNAKVFLPPAADVRFRHRMGISLVDALLDLGEVDHTKVGLTDFGRPDGFLERQVPRWMSELESFASLQGYSGPQLGDIERVANWLVDNRPAAWTPGILHGDYHAANVMFDHDRPAVAAIVDWEMSTIGDPVLDLGALLAVWPRSDGEPDLIGSEYSQAGGLPTEAELVARYRDRSTRDTSALDWYFVLGCFKLGIVLEGTYARAQAGQADLATGESLHATAVQLLERARRRLSG